MKVKIRKLTNRQRKREKKNYIHSMLCTKNSNITLKIAKTYRS